jgi:hypothetical protein
MRFNREKEKILTAVGKILIVITDFYGDKTGGIQGITNSRGKQPVVIGEQFCPVGIWVPVSLFG